MRNMAFTKCKLVSLHPLLNCLFTATYKPHADTQCSQWKRQNLVAVFERFFHYRFFIAIFGFCTILSVMENVASVWRSVFIRFLLPTNISRQAGRQVTLPSSWTAPISLLKSFSSILPNSPPKCFQSGSSWILVTIRGPSRPLSSLTAERFAHFVGTRLHCSY